MRSAMNSSNEGLRAPCMGLSFVTSRLTQSSPISRRNGTYKHTDPIPGSEAAAVASKQQALSAETSRSGVASLEPMSSCKWCANLLDEVAVQEHGDLRAQKGRHLAQQLLLVVAAKNAKGQWPSDRPSNKSADEAANGWEHGGQQPQQQKGHHTKSTGWEPEYALSTNAHTKRR